MSTVISESMFIFVAALAASTVKCIEQLVKSFYEFYSYTGIIWQVVQCT